MNRIICILLVFVLLVGMLPSAVTAVEAPQPAAGNTEAAQASGVGMTQTDTPPVATLPVAYSNTIRDFDIAIYGTRRTSFLEELDGGGYQAVVCYDGTLYIETFDAEWNSVASSNLELELDTWGGYYAGEQYNYVVCGQWYDDTLEDGGEVYRIIKYDKDFRRLGSISFTSDETYTAGPFYYGNVSIAEAGNSLTVYTSRLRLDGHQSNIALRINTEDMTVRDPDGMAASPDIHVSHSLRQIVRFDGTSETYVDLSDAYPVRSVYFQSEAFSTPLFIVDGEYGNNVTNTEVSGLEISDTHCFVVGSAIHLEEQNIFLSVIDKETEEVTTKWLSGSTAFSPQTVHAPRIVKISEDRFVVMWNVEGAASVYYLILDQEGNAVCARKEAYSLLLTSCEPIYSDGKIIWLSIQDGNIRPEALTDLTETGTYEWVSPIVDPVDPWDGTADTSWYTDAETDFSITTPAQLAGLSELAAAGNTFLGKTVSLENDLFMNGETFTNDWPSIALWEGTFNGNGHTIYNLYQADETGGLFHTVGESGLVKAVTLAQGIFAYGGCFADINKGILAFCNSRSLVYDDLDSSRLGNGAICNENHNLVYGCKNYGKMIGSTVAGIVGVNADSLSVVSQCSNIGTVAGSNNVSGIVAYNYGWVYNNYSTGFVFSKTGTPNEADDVSGIVGFEHFTQTGDIESCYTLGNFSYSSRYALRSFYSIASEGIINCYSRISGTEDEALITVLTAEQMRSPEFVELLNLQTHDKIPSWVADTEQINNGYPITVADYNAHHGIYKIQPELWVGLNQVVSLKPGSTLSVNCDSYYNETPLTIAVSDSSVATATLSGSTLTITALQSGVTWLNFHFDGTENVVETDYQVKIVVDAYSGYCGNDATWAFDPESGLLTIGGTGMMYDFASYSAKRAPWYEYRDQITAVEIADGITSIGNLAFVGCDGLTDVILPDSVTSIGTSAFQDCSGLVSISLSANLTDIGANAFKYCSSLTSIALPKPVKQIGEEAFRYCDSLTRFDVDTQNAYYASDEQGVLFNKAMTTLIQAPCMLTGSYDIPDSVTTIGTYAFYDCAGMTAVDIPDGVTSIGNFAFSECTSLTAVVIPQSVTYLNKGVFSNCDKLSSVTLPNGMTGLSNYAFYQCGALRSITIPDTVTYVGGDAFSGCTGLTSITIPDSVTYIHSDAFYECTGLLSAHIGSGMRTIHDFAFYRCTSLASLTFAEGIQTIDEYAFDYCSALTDVTIPASVTSIGSHAFGSCSSLRSITFAGDAPDMDIGAFSKVVANVYYPIDNTTWTADVRANYGGTLTWIAVCAEHVWQEWHVVREAACSETGEEQRCCANCEYYESRTIPATGHDHVPAVTAPTCSEQGYTVYTCSVCGDSYTDHYVDALGHDYVSAVTAATCTEGGYTTHTCTRCNDSYTDSHTEPLSHSYVSVVTEPTCVDGGYTTHTCTRCAEVYVDSHVSALGHSWDEGVVITEPTEEEDGLRRHSCTVCGITEDRIIPALGHEHRYESVVTDPTCTEGGYTTYTCGCGDSYTDHHVDALGHSFTEYISDNNAACTQDGTKTAVCDRSHCDATDTVTDPGSAHGHDFTDWTVVEKPTQTAEGLECRYCLNCGMEETRVIARLENPFTDVPSDAFYYEPVMWAVENGITNGTSATTFGPNDQCMRAHVVTFLWRAVGCPEPAGIDNPFVDVKETDFYYKAVMWALENNITSGMDATHFGPTAYCNRAQVVTFLYRTMGSPELDSAENPFTDVAPGTFYEKPVLWAVMQGITNGLSPTTFGPNAICNRAQIVTFLYRAFLDD